MTTTAHNHQRFLDALRSACTAIGVNIDGRQADLFWRHFELLVETNQRFNLTRITDAADAAVKHYADALTLLATPLGGRAGIRGVLDVGTGAGFPAFPLAVMRPDWRLTAMDSTGKKARFVAESAETLEVANLTGLHHRAGEKTADGRRYDLVLYRAVTRLAGCLETAKRLVKGGGHIVCYKGDSVSSDERRDGEAMMKQMGFRADSEHAFRLPLAQGEIGRRLVVFQKINSKNQKHGGRNKA